MNYTFKNADNNFIGSSTVYDVYDEDNMQVASIVVGFCSLNKIYYFTEYRGAGNHCSIRTQEEFNGILYSFSQLFECLDYLDIISKESTYEKYKDLLPLISKDKLYIYDSYADICLRDYKWLVVPDDNFIEYLVDEDILEGSELLLEDYDDDNNLYIDLNDASYYVGDTLDGFYLYVKDWDALEQKVLSYNN